MKRYIVRIPGFRLTVSAYSVWHAVDQVMAAFPAPRSLSAKAAP